MDKKESTINAGASATETLTATGRESATLLCLKCKHSFKSYEPLVVLCTKVSPSMLLHLLPSGASFPVFYLLIQGFHEEVHDFFQVDVKCLWVNGLPFEGRDQGYLFLWDIFHLNTTHLLHAHIREVQFAAVGHHHHYLFPVCWVLNEECGFAAVCHTADRAARLSQLVPLGQLLALEKSEAVGKVPEVAEERRLGSALHLRPLECLTTITTATLQAHLRLWIWKGDLYLSTDTRYMGCHCN